MKVGKGNDFRNTWYTWLIKSSIPFLKRKIPSRFVPGQDNFSQDISLAGHSDLLCLTSWRTALSAFDKKKKDTHISLGWRDEVLKGHIAQCLRVRAPQSNCLGLLLAMWPWASYLSPCLSLLICKWDNYTTVLIGLLTGIKEVTYVQCLKVPGPCKYKNKNC